MPRKYYETESDSQEGELSSQDSCQAYKTPIRKRKRPIDTRPDSKQRLRDRRNKSSNNDGKMVYEVLDDSDPSDDSSIGRLDQHGPTYQPVVVRKNSPRFRNWTVTVNIGKQAWSESSTLKALWEPIGTRATIRGGGTYGTYPPLTYMCFGREHGQPTGNRHYQTFCHYSDPVAKEHVVADLLVIFKVHAHVEPSNGTILENKIYCGFADYNKDGKHKPKNPTFTEFGVEPKQGERNDINEAARLIYEGESMQTVALQCPTVMIKYPRGLQVLKQFTNCQRRDPSTPTLVYWLYGKTGLGKSRTAWKAFPEAYSCPKSKWWDGYAGQKVVILDDLRSTTFPFDFLLNLLDRYPLQVEFKGGVVEMVTKIFVITCPKLPATLFSMATLREDLEQLNRRVTHILLFRDSHQVPLLTKGLQDENVTSLLRHCLL